jgi:hypothetical protein
LWWNIAAGGGGVDGVMYAWLSAAKGRLLLVFIIQEGLIQASIWEERDSSIMGAGHERDF